MSKPDYLLTQRELEARRDRENARYELAHNPALMFPEGQSRVRAIPGQGHDRKLFAVTCISNPVRYESRYRLYRDFAQRMEDAGVILYTVEMAFADRPHEVTSWDHPRHIQLRSNHELWHKENMLNIGISRMPVDAKYIAWIDADISFARPDWVKETIEQLQHYQVVQMFSTAVDLNARFEAGKTHKGFMYEFYHNKSRFSAGATADYQEGHPGYAWAARREALNAVGGLMDFAMLGSADRHMAGALIGHGDKTYHKDVHPKYKHMVAEWQRRAEQNIKRNVGYVPGTIWHNYHGSKANRHYQSRWKILVEHKFDPVEDLFRDTQGLWQLEADRAELRDAIRRYFRSRHEDDISEGNDKLLA